MVFYLNQVRTRITKIGFANLQKVSVRWPQIIFKSTSSSVTSPGLIFSSLSRSKIRSSASFTVCRLHIMVLPQTGAVREVLFIDQRTRTDWCNCVVLDTIVCVRENVSANVSELVA